MLKPLMRAKKFAAVFVLMLMVAYAAVPIVHALNYNGCSITRQGSRKTDGQGNYSYTKVTGYDRVGNKVNMVAGASMGYDWYYGRGTGTATARSASVAGTSPVEHAFGIGNNVDMSTKWVSP